MTKDEGLAHLIDCSEEEFIEGVAKQNVGYLTNLEKLLHITYSQLNRFREGLVTQQQTAPKSDQEEIIKALKDIYLTMIAVERRIFILKEKIAKLAI